MIEMAEVDQPIRTDSDMESVLQGCNMSLAEDRRYFPKPGLSALTEYVGKLHLVPSENSSNIWTSGWTLRELDFAVRAEGDSHQRFPEHYWLFDKRSIATWLFDSGFRYMESPSATLSLDAQEWIAGIVVSGNPDLRDAHRDLMAVKEEAEEEGFGAPSYAARDVARRLLYAMYDIWPRRFEVYPTPNGSIAIDTPDGHGRSVVVLCESSGSVLCSVNMRGSYRQARYDDASGLPDGFLREALNELRGRNTQAKWR